MHFQNWQRGLRYFLRLTVEVKFRTIMEAGQIIVLTRIKNLVSQWSHQYTEPWILRTQLKQILIEEMIAVRFLMLF